jgi:hypothetical protein
MAFGSLMMNLRRHSNRLPSRRLLFAALSLIFYSIPQRQKSKDRRNENRKNEWLHQMIDSGSISSKNQQASSNTERAIEF